MKSRRKGRMEKITQKLSKGLSTLTYMVNNIT